MPLLSCRGRPWRGHDEGRGAGSSESQRVEGPWEPTAASWEHGVLSQGLSRPGRRGGRGLRGLFGCWAVGIPSAGRTSPRRPLRQVTKPTQWRRRQPLVCGYVLHGNRRRRWPLRLPGDGLRRGPPPQVTALAGRCPRGQAPPPGLCLPALWPLAVLSPLWAATSSVSTLSSRTLKTSSAKGIWSGSRGAVLAELGDLGMTKGLSGPQSAHLWNKGSAGLWSRVVKVDGQNLEARRGRLPTGGSLRLPLKRWLSTPGRSRIWLQQSGRVPP